MCSQVQTLRKKLSLPAAGNSRISFVPYGPSYIKFVMRQIKARRPAILDRMVIKNGLGKFTIQKGLENIGPQM